MKLKFRDDQFLSGKAGRIPIQSIKMFQTKSMLFAVVALMVVGSAIAIIGGKDAVRGKFPYFAYLKCYQIKPNFSWKSPVIFKKDTCKKR